MPALPEESLSALILERDSPRPDAEIGRIIALHLPIPATDAIARVRYGGGLIVKGIPETAAEEIARDLRAIGVGTRIIGAERWGPVPRGRRVTWLSLEGDSLRTRPGGPVATSSPGPVVTGLLVPRDQVLGIALVGTAPPPPPAPPRKSRLRSWTERDEPEPPRLGLDEALAYREPVSSLLLDSGEGSASGAEIPSLSPRGAELVRNLSRHGLAGMRFCLKLYLRELPGILRLERDAIDFGCLGDQKQAHSLDNFLLLVEGVLDFLPGAWNRRTAERFLAELDPRLIQCAKEEEAQNFDRWMLEWVRIEREADSRGRTP